MKKIKVSMIICIIIIILIIITLFILSNVKSEPEQSQNTINVSNQTVENTTVPQNNTTDTNNVNDEEPSNGTTVVTSYDTFYTIEKCINQYLNIINRNNSLYFSFDRSTNESEQIVTDEEINENILNLLDTQYIQNNNINTSNVQDYVGNIQQSLMFTALQMRTTNANSNIQKYIVYGVRSTSKCEFIDYMYIIVNIDRNNNTFCVEPLNIKPEENPDVNVSNIPLAETSYGEISINDLNQYSTVSATIDNICENYFVTYKKLLQIKPEILYYAFTDEYKEARFKTLKDFEKFVESNKQDLMEAQYQQYASNDSAYICKDQYENYYRFTVSAPMNFTLELDNYSIFTESKKRSYDILNNNEKVQENIKKWIQMLNCRDYYSAYNVLNEDFKNSNWSSLDNFTEYIKQRFPEHYTVKFSSTKSENNTYNVTVSLINMDNSEDIIETTMYIKLQDDYKFTISFDI